MTILLGFEVGSANPIYLPLHHLIITGMTRLSGKTTTLEALVARSGLKAITFRTKRGEIGFEVANKVPLYFDDTDLTEWRALEGLMEATLEEKVRREPGVRAAIIKICRNPSPAKNLGEVYERVVQWDENPKTRGFEKDVSTKLRAYLEIVIPQIERLRFVKNLELGSGANMMDLVEEGLSDEMQSLVLYGVLKRIYEVEKDTIVVIPEAWKFIPQDRGSPCKPIVEKLIREGGAVGNYLWIDSQDLRGVDKKYTRSIDNWVLGRQKDDREIIATLKAVTTTTKPKPEEIKTLAKGHFIACLHDDVFRVYVQPLWLGEDEAKAIALGKIDVDSVIRPVLEEDEELWKQKYEESEALLKAASNKIVGLEETKREADKQIAEAKAKVENICVFIESLKKLLNLEVTEIDSKRLNLNTYEINMRLSPIQRTVELDAEKSYAGKILQIMLTDLKGQEWVTTVDLSNALAEHGWPRSKDSVRLDLLGMTKDGLIVKEGTKYRLPTQVRVVAAEESEK